MSAPYKSLVCRGSIALGSACGHCEKCHDERVRMAKPAQGLPVAGYKSTQPQHLIDLVNENKILEEKILRQVERHKDMGSELDQRSIALAFTQIQDAFMWLNRGVFQPSRLQGELE